MRLRKVKQALPYIIANKDKATVFKDEELNYSLIFRHNQPIHIEVGCGKGQMIYNLAQENPLINYIAIDKYDSVLYYALKKQEDKHLTNLHYLLIDAKDLNLALVEKSISRIYLTFSDPWPKTRHAKRRLTSPEFLALFKNILKPSGEIVFKTDEKDFFFYSKEQFIEHGFKIIDETSDLKNYNCDNELTEYEEKYNNKANIYYLKVVKC